MPNFDGRGPRGKGPRTGRQLGDCDETTEQKESNKSSQEEQKNKEDSSVTQKDK